MQNLSLKISTGFTALLVSMSVYAVVQISAALSPYSSAPAIVGVSVQANAVVRQAALAQAWGLYRSVNGPLVLGRGSTFKLTYMDGSAENASVLCTTSSACIEIVPGSQTQPSSSDGSSGGSGSSGGGGSGSGSGSGSGTIDPPSSPPPGSTVCIDVPGGLECTLIE